MLEKYIDNSIIPVFNKKTNELDKKQKEEYYKHLEQHSKYPQLNPQMSSVIAVNTLNQKAKWQNKGFDWVVGETNSEFKKPKYEKQRQDIGTLLSNYKDALIYYLG